MKKLFAIKSLIFALATAFVFSAVAGTAIAQAFNSDHAGMYIDTLFAASLIFQSPKGVVGVVFLQGICEKVQSSLIALFGADAPSLTRTKVGYLQALTSPQNMSGMTIMPIDPGNGKIKQVRVKYIQRGTESTTVTAKPSMCSPGDEVAPFEDIKAITNYIGSVEMKFNEAEMRKLCEPDSEYMQAVVNANIDKVVRALNKKLITIQSVNFGAFNPAVVGAKSVQLLDAANLNRAVYAGEATILADLEYLDVSERPLLIGSGNLSTYARMEKIGCCNAFGQDIGQAGNFDYFQDRFVGGILGNANDFICLVPGHVQLLTYNEYVGTYVKENDVFSHGTIVDPVTGLTFDIRWIYTYCNGEFYTMQMGLWYDMYFMPGNAFGYSDELFGYNGSLHYRATAA